MKDGARASEYARSRVPKHIVSPSEYPFTLKDLRAAYAAGLRMGRKLERETE